MAKHQCVLILDYGSQYTQLIARRIREDDVYCEVHPWDVKPSEMSAIDPIGVILSGGPDSVYGEFSPRVVPAVFELGVPVLGICYGMQGMALALGGKVEGSSHREYGPGGNRHRSTGSPFSGSRSSGESVDESR